MYCQNEYKHEKRAHHNLAYSFKPLLYANAANKYSGNNCYSHPKAHFTGACQHIVENLARVLISVELNTDSGVLPEGKVPIKKLKEIVQHPTRNGSVVHHKHIAAYYCKPTVNVPFVPGLSSAL